LPKARAIDAKDHYNAGHVTVSHELALALGKVMDYSQEKLRISRSRPRCTTWARSGSPIRSYSRPPNSAARNGNRCGSTQDGSDIIRSIEELAGVATVIRHHHERIDGGGYPDGLAGEAIPQLSRTIAVAMPTRPCPPTAPTARDASMTKS